jgi:hypothetical protein
MQFLDVAYLPTIFKLSQNTRYVVISGARQKEEDWDPEENGGFAVHGERFHVGSAALVL